MIDLDCTHRFLQLLDEVGPFTFQTFAESTEATGSACFPRILHGALEEHTEELIELNASGAGIFVMVNKGDGKTHPGNKSCRTEANVIRVRALFVDLDGAPLAPVLGAPAQPDWIAQTSRGRWHAYWKVCDCPLTEFSHLQAALAQKFEGDRSVKDLARVMRVPGFCHRKREIFVSQLYLPAQYADLLGAQDE